MIYPKFLEKNEIIGVTAPSAGITDPLKINRLNNAVKTFEELGFKVIETNNVRTDIKGSSSSPRKRAKQLEDLFSNPEVKVIYCATGGDFLLEMLSYLNTEIIKNNPKWIQGYSDPTGILFLITTKLDIATIYGNNFCSFGMEKWDNSIENSFQFINGKNLVQNSFPKYEQASLPIVTGLEGYNLDTPVVWKNLWNSTDIEISGRLIGGCLDVLVSLVGTRFDCVKEFVTKYKDDGIIWYFDNCELTSEGVIRALWQLKEAGWFKYTKGILFGRSMTNSSYYGITFEEALKRSLEDLQVNVLWDLDFGHVPPALTLVNGALTKVKYQEGHGSIEFILE